MLLRCIVLAVLFYVAGALPREGLTPRITDGKTAKVGQFPYQISLEWSMLPILVPYTHVCGASIINENWVLTAGHCLTEIPKFGKMRVNAGKYKIIEAGPEQQVVKISRKVVHEKYPGGVAPYDIALLKLEHPLVFNDHVGPVSLPKQEEEFEGEVVLSGWGSVSKKVIPSLPKVLQYAEMPLIDYESCRTALGTFEKDAKLYKTQICTGPLKKTTSACSGDSGGPLVKMVNNTPVQVGIVSWGMLPCGHGAPSVYTRVASYADWIKENVKA